MRSNPKTSTRGTQRRREQACEKCGEVHQRCAAHNRAGKPCMKHPVEGGWVCRMHGGTNEVAQQKATRAVTEQKIREAMLLGDSLEVSPTEAMLAAVYEAAANVEVYRVLVQSLQARETHGRAGLAGLTGSISKENDAAPHVWVTLYNDERDRLVKYSKLCRDAGVDEALLQLEHDKAAILAHAVLGVGDAIKALLLQKLSGKRGVVEAMFRDEVPGLMRQAIVDAASREADGPG